MGFQAKEISFQTQDKIQLYGWFFPAETSHPKGTVIQFHGNAENMSSHYLSLVWLVKHGYNLFIFDYRGYGKSKGSPSQEGTYKDALAALEQGLQLHRQAGGGRLIVYAQSLGGVIAMRALEDFKGSASIQLAVMDSTFLSYHEVARSKLQGTWLFWLSPLVPLLVSDEYSAEKAAETTTLPLLIIHDEQDRAVPYSSGFQIYRAANSERVFWKLNDAQHVGIFSLKWPEHRDRFVQYLEKF